MTDEDHVSGGQSAGDRHGDRPALLRWLGAFDHVPGRICLAHGEQGPAEALARRLRYELRVEVGIPAYGDAIEP